MNTSGSVAGGSRWSFQFLPVLCFALSNAARSHEAKSPCEARAGPCHVAFRRSQCDAEQVRANTIPGRSVFLYFPPPTLNGIVRLGTARGNRAHHLLADTEPGENPSQQIIRGELAGDLAQGVLRGAQLLGDQLPGTVLGELARGCFGVLEIGRAHV